MIYALAFIFLGTGAVFLFYAVMIYNGLVRLKNNVKKAWSNIDVILKQRHDELPKLVEVCKQSMKFEQETLEKVIRARSAVASASESGDAAALGRAETQLRAALGGIYAVAEAYPDLKTNATFNNLHIRISQLENAISDRRELYNEEVNMNNTRLEQFPDNFIAGFGNFSPCQLLSFDPQEIQDVNIKGLFS